MSLEFLPPGSPTIVTALRSGVSRGGASESTGAALRVAVAAVGDPRLPQTWSGVAAGVVGGLGELGVEIVPLDLSLPPAFELAMLAAAAAPTRNRYDAESAALTDRVRSLLARVRLRGQRLDGVIQMGTTFALPEGTSYVTLEDMTLRQGDSSHPVFSRMSARAIERWEERRAEIYARARMCTVASHWAADSLRTDYGLPAERIAVVGFGANHRANVPRRDWSSPRYLFVGIDWERKGGPMLLRAFDRVRSVLPQAVLDVVGAHPPLEVSGATGHGVLSLASPQERSLLLDLFAHATCFVMPSSIEPFGIAYVEAGSAGLPSIASRTGGPRDVIGEEGGLLVDAGDEDALVQAMLELADAGRAQGMGEAARARSALYTWRKVAERLLRALGLPAPDGRGLAGFL